MAASGKPPQLAGHDVHHLGDALANAIILPSGARGRRLALENSKVALDAVEDGRVVHGLRPLLD